LIWNDEITAPEGDPDQTAIIIRLHHHLNR
jgi:hypothetical protein